MPHRVASGVGNEKAASAAYHVQMAMFCHNNYVNASV